ncbi:MAG: hypothetical protein HC866_05165 [Leptolyngbyaceae cyanobacterium RU_5_1]|nr:hypothetical protein [Leptolyngbyaceae cyanobacterium RU_5_1]
MNQKLTVQPDFKFLLQQTWLNSQDYELLLIKALLVAVERESYQEFRNVMSYAIAEFPNLFESEHFSQEEIQQIKSSFEKDSYAAFRQSLISIEACGHTIGCWSCRRCPPCSFLDATKALVYEDFHVALKQDLVVNLALLQS